MSEHLITIAKFDDNFEADLAKALLEDHGINAFLKNELVYSMIPGIMADKFYIELQVGSLDEERARGILESQISGSEIKNILVAEEAFLEGHFLLTSGRHSNAYVEKIRILQNPVATTEVCAMLADMVAEDDFDTVVGPAYGGIVLAYEVARMLDKRFVFTQRKDEKMTIRDGFDLTTVKRVVVVEDIITTGGSVTEVMACLKEYGIEVVSVAAIVDRGGGKADFGCPLHSLLQLDIPSWTPEECPLCLEGVALTKPGASDKKI